jgi:predicted RNA-binding protein with RPS1 domain
MDTQCIYETYLFLIYISSLVFPKTVNRFKTETTAAIHRTITRTAYFYIRQGGLRSTMAPPYHDRGDGKSDRPPPVDSIERGEVMRIEDYGAFVQLERYRGMRGLVHISQISEGRLEKVTDAVSVQDTVWVKVLEVSEEESPDGRPRHKIRLSMKDASQDGSAQDLGAISQARDQASHALESNLNSTIGMGFARDPMAGYSSGSRLVMKHEKKDAQVINGYALVDDTEGEMPEPAAPVNVDVAPMAPKAPLGRGRGTTLPAWMTKQDSDEPGPSKVADKHNGSDDDSSGRRHRKKKDKSRRKDRKKHSSRKHDDRHRESKRSKRRYSEDEEEEEERRHRKRKSHRRSRSRSEDSAKDRDRTRRRHRDKQSDEPERERDHSRPGNNRDQYSDASEDGVQFQSVEEAKKLIEEIDAKRRESRDE